MIAIQLTQLNDNKSFYNVNVVFSEFLVGLGSKVIFYTAIRQDFQNFKLLTVTINHYKN